MQRQAIDPLAAANGLRDLILEHRHETESNRGLARPIVEGLVENRLGRLALPAEYAGLEVPPADALAVYEALAEAEASVAWIAWNSSLPCWFARFLGDTAREQIFTDPEALYASSTRPSGWAEKQGDAYIVNGRWSLVSGCMHATWIPVMCRVEVNGELQMLAPNVPHMRVAFVPRAAHEILDTWHSGGLRGTGSHDSVLTDERVPAERTFAVGDASLMDSPLGRIPITCTMSAGCASICTGIANRSLQTLIDLATQRESTDGAPGLRDRAAVQSLVAEAQTQLASLRTHLRSATTALWETAVAGTEIQHAQIGAVFTASIVASQECQRIVSDIYAAAGTPALYTDNPIERAHRDIHAVMRHVVLQPFWLEQAGRVRLGLEPTHALFSI